jgi:phage tail-like protein
MALAVESKIGMAMRFRVVVDDNKYDLGSWAKVSGLEVSWDLVEYRAGDNDNERWYFPGLSKYPHIKLERAATHEESGLVKDWLNKTSFRHEVTSGKIELLDAHLDPVMEWDLRHVIPVKWSVVPFEATSSKVATETLEIAHMGFLMEEK